jgi:large subunit ribosomal protein L10
MALTRDKKEQVVAEVSDLLKSSKLTVVATYQGTTVKAMQELRRQASSSGTQVSVVKNRLVKKALEQTDAFKQFDSSILNGQLLYAFNSQDEVAPAQSLAAFARTNPSIEFVGALTVDGQFMAAADVKALAALPSKPQLIAGIISTLQSPTRTIMSSLTGNLHGLLDAVAARAGN